MQRHLNHQRGQGMTEYIIIVAMIAIAAIAVYQYFGQTVRYQTTAIAQELAGENGTADRGLAKDAAGAAKAAAVKVDLDTYTAQKTK
jgi:type IV pilus assembly protein PilA